MSEKARRKRLMRLRGEKRDKDDKLPGSADYMIPMMRLDAITDQLQTNDPGISLIADHDQFMGRFEMSEENIDAAGEGLDAMNNMIGFDVRVTKDFAAAGAWLQRNQNYGHEGDRSEAELPPSQGAVPGEELESGEIPSRARDHETLEEEGRTPAETPDDQS